MVWSAPSGEVLIDIVSRPGQTEHGHGALAYGGKQAGVAPARPAAPYAPSYPSALRLHQPYGSAALSYRDSYARGSGGGAVGEYRAGARMSLLGSAYLPPPAPPAHHPPPADPPPFKKIRLAAERPAAKPHQQLRVDTREPVMNSYNSTVEVLSPNPPSEPTLEDQSFRTTKDDLLQQISKVDREMALSETTLQKLKKKQEELEQSASKPALTEEPEEAPPRHRSLAQCIYADNRKRAAAAHAVLAHLGPPVLYPLYNQPQDTHVYHENIRKNRAFRKRLAEHLKRVRLETEKREDALTEEYSRRASDWMRRVERIEQGQKRKTKDARNREFFEKVFPELRKAREERERFNRLGARVKSEAELEEIADGLHEQEHEDKKMRSLTVVPPLLRDPRQPRALDTNKRCMDMETEHKELQLRNVWTCTEQEVFREKYLQHPKNFGQIASFLPRKSVRDCVRFYYLSKKAQNYKQLLRKPRPRRHARPRPAPEPELPAGVTTRLQRIQGSARVADKDNMEELPQTAEPTPVDLIPVPPAAPAHPARSEMNRTPPLPPSPPPASSAPQAPVANTTSGSPSDMSGSSGPTGLSGSTGLTGLSSNSLGPDGLSNTSGLMSSGSTSSASLSVPNALSSTSSAVNSSNVSVVTSASGPVGSPTVSAPTPPASEAMVPILSELPPVTVAATTATVITTTSAPSGGAVSTCLSGSAPPTPQPAHPPTHPPPTPEPAMTERTSTPSLIIPPSSATTTTVTIGSTSCAVCSASGATRSVAPSRAAHYGLDPSAAGARVCEACHCRFVRARRSRCTVPSCAGPRAKRLRHLPPRWHDLPQDLKRPLMEEFQIPGDLSKCCLTCFKRITRRLDTIGEGGSAPEPTEDEAAGFRTLLREHGTAWERMSAASGRTPASLKAFYFTYRKKLQLDILLSERQPARGSDTDDSILSSGDTDTASAESPRPPPLPGPRTDAVAPRRHRRDEYDSSATETADEENDAPSAKTIAPAPAPAAAAGAGTGAGAGAGTGATGVPCSIPGAVPVVGAVSAQSVGAGVGTSVGASVGAPLTVRDVVLNMIEVSLMRNSRPLPPHSNTQPGNHPHAQPPKVSTHEPLATLTVVSGAGHAGHAAHGSSPHSPRSPHRGATITPLPPDGGKDVMLLHIEPRAAPPHHLSHSHATHAPHPPHAPHHPPADPLDLSEKRPRHDLPPKPQHRNAEYAAYRAAERQSPTQYNNKPKPVASPRPPLKLPANPKGSITLGTPVEARYEPQRIPSDPKTGSITAGTPVHGPHHLPDKRNLEYRRRSPGGAYYAGAGAQQRPQSPSSFQNATATAVSRGTYGLERRQIMLTDYITSQQMHGVVRREREPSHHHQQQQHQHQQQQHQQQQQQQQQHQQQQQQQHQQQQHQQQQHQQQQQHLQQQLQQQHQHQHQAIRRDRDTVSVIQKHTHTYSHPHPPPGHEAFAQLVNAASIAPALPVPRRDEPAPEPPASSPLHHPQHQQHPQHPQHMHHDIRSSREFTMSQKYHPQYPPADRRPPPPQQRDVRDSRERMVPIQERHYVIEQHQPHQQHQQHQHSQHPQHTQQLLIDRHLIPTHSQNISSGDERRGSTGSAGGGAYGAPGKRPIHTLDRKDGRTAVSVASVTSVSGAGVTTVAAPASVSAASGAELSAASLINAIITQKISQTSNQRFPSKIIRESDAVQSQSDRMLIDHQRDRESERDRDRENDGPPQLTGHTTSMKLGDLASNIIVRDFSSPNTNSLLHHNNRFAVSSADTYASSGTGSGAGSAAAGGAGGSAGAGGAASGAAADEWRRDAPKHAPYLEPVSPPDNHHTGRGSAGGRRYSAAHVGGGSVLTAYDYVTTRIVEVMRSDEERSKPPFHPPTSYAYPYSALNVATPATDVTTVSGGASPAAPLPAPVQPEPAPLMSAQYEPLSDED